MKYTVKMSCGHEDTVSLIGKNSERERKIAYYEAYGVCKECYKKQMEEKAKTEGFVFNGTVLSGIDNQGNILVNVWFSGDTKPHKDEIKSLGGYHWNERETMEDEIPGEHLLLCWNKVISLKNLAPEIEKAVSIGANVIITKEKLYTEYNYQRALVKQQEWNERNKKLAEIPKPNVPDVLKGCRWNQKIYGKSGNYSIYPDGEKVMISDEQAEEIKCYLEEKAEYLKKIEEIENA